ncbi:alpha/beta fold hydrolase [Micromonospora sp. NBC_01796]|uniref:alpha/beta fold hydrolase n=1 Tax=Micromonospora sp. NBC_01796 TaxID=2975987 RepID=UPI002DDB9FB0|nr:alpha/beta hydrolase [Micromonospora sp. NBC_01796]WSA83972.1 alpha/beta hydrolase [Micromonospora sp. NBC_01796]
MEIYFEDHGTGPGRPLILVPAALSGIRTSYGVLMPLLAKRRRVVAIELPGHGRTPDCDGPYTVEGFAAEVVHLLDRLGLPQADVLGWGLGAAVALRVGTHHPARAGRLVLASSTFDRGGLHPGLLDGAQRLRPEHLYGSELHEEYLRTAPDRAGWDRLVTKMAVLDAHPPEWTPAQIRALRVPALVVVGDADIVRPEHAVRMFRLLGGGVPGDVCGLPRCRLAILPGTTHASLPQRAALLAPLVEEFLDEGLHPPEATGRQRPTPGSAPRTG